MGSRSIYGVVNALIRPPRKEIRILTYHRVNPDTRLPDVHISVSPKAFKQQMAWLHQNKWRVISLREAINQISKRNIRAEKQVVITFDDGFRDNFEFAFPVLWHYKFPATIYLISSKCTKHSDYLDYYQIQIMQQHQISFGAHTVTHPNLAEIQEHQAWEEIIKSKTELEGILGKPVSSFAYPSGRFNAIHQKMLSQADFQSGLTVAPGGNGVNENLLRLKRTEIANHDSLFDFRNKLLGGFDLLHRLVQFKQGLYPAPQPLNRKAS